MLQDLQADLELLARRVQLLEAIIWPGNDAIHNVLPSAGLVKKIQEQEVAVLKLYSLNAQRTYVVVRDYTVQPDAAVTGQWPQNSQTQFSGNP